ncbi:MAG TPA: septal ring lytic transglycosylase RlpA family protein [bacterium]|nr:septal ring lytic transglycosylase RlpA family protein [bacterium]
MQTASAKFFLLCAALLLLIGCASDHVVRRPTGWSQTGYASWYGETFQGRRTASGETFDYRKLTAAHKTLPFGTYVEVTRLDNGRKVVVKINDRGPFVHGRIIDLSKAAAQKLDMVRDGVAKVKISVVR